MLDLLLAQTLSISPIAQSLWNDRDRWNSAQSFACASPVKVEGGSETHIKQYAIPTNNTSQNSVSFNIQLYTIVDSFSVQVSNPNNSTNKVILEKKRVSGNFSENISVSPGDVIKVSVVGNPKNQGTRWNYKLDCLESIAKSDLTLVVVFTGFVQSSDDFPRRHALRTLVENLNQDKQIKAALFETRMTYASAEDAVKWLEDQEENNKNSQLSIIVVGHSWGAPNILKFANLLKRQDNKSIDKAIFLDPIFRWMENAQFWSSVSLPGNIKSAINYWQIDHSIQNQEFKEGGVLVGYIATGQNIEQGHPSIRGAVNINAETFLNAENIVENINEKAPNYNKKVTELNRKISVTNSRIKRLNSSMIVFDGTEVERMNHVEAYQETYQEFSRELSKEIQALNKMREDIKKDIKKGLELVDHYNIADKLSKHILNDIKLGVNRNPVHPTKLKLAEIKKLEEPLNPRDIFNQPRQ